MQAFVSPAAWLPELTLKRSCEVRRNGRSLCVGLAQHDSPDTPNETEEISKQG